MNKQLLELCLTFAGNEAMDDGYDELAERYWAGAYRLRHEAAGGAA